MKNWFSCVIYIIFTLFVGIFSTCLNLFVAAALSNDAFYMFQVGQGNSQFVRYDIDGKNIGILYDAGSSSGMEHNKFRFNNELQKIFKLCGDSDKDFISSQSSDETKPTKVLGKKTLAITHPNRRITTGPTDVLFTTTSQQQLI